MRSLVRSYVHSSSEGASLSWGNAFTARRCAQTLCALSTFEGCLREYVCSMPPRSFRGDSASHPPMRQFSLG